MAEGFLHLNGHTYQLSPAYLADDGTALQQLQDRIDELASGTALSAATVTVVIRGQDVPLRISPAGVQCAAVGITLY